MDDFVDPPKNLTDKTIKDTVQLYYNNDLIQEGDFTTLIGRN